MLRWVSSIKEGSYKAMWAVPVSLEEKYDWPTTTTAIKIEEMESSKPKEIRYPPPRPPPKTRLLNKTAEAVAAHA
jgi:hypothetical protein